MTFACPPYTFTLDDGFAVLDLGEALCELAVDDFDRLILEIPAVQLLPAAPLASWLLARLCQLNGGLGLQSDAVECIEGGVWVLDFVVHGGEQPVAKVQLQAGTIGAGLLGVAVDPEQAEGLMQALLQALHEAPSAVAVCRIRIRDPEADLEYTYGFDGQNYLGAENPGPLSAATD